MASFHPSHLVVLAAAACLLLATTEAGRPVPILANPWTRGCNPITRCRGEPPASDVHMDSDQAAGIDSSQIHPGTKTNFPGTRPIPVEKYSSVGAKVGDAVATSDVHKSTDAEVGVNAGTTLPPPSNPWHRGCISLYRCRGGPPASDVDTVSDKADHVDAGGLPKPAGVGKF